MLSDAYLHGGNADEALVHIEEALRKATRTGERWFVAELHRRLGRVLLCLHPEHSDRAEAEYLCALEIAHSQSARLFALRAAYDYALLLRDRCRTAEAHDMLARVYASFTEGFTFTDLVEARALLDELSAGGSTTGVCPAI